MRACGGATFTVLPRAGPLLSFCPKSTAGRAFSVLTQIGRTFRIPSDYGKLARPVRRHGKSGIYLSLSSEPTTERHTALVTPNRGTHSFRVSFPICPRQSMCQSALSFVEGCAEFFFRHVRRVSLCQCAPVPSLREGVEDVECRALQSCRSRDVERWRAL